jgi:hypothetical protein
VLDASSSCLRVFVAFVFAFVFSSWRDSELA